VQKQLTISTVVVVEQARACERGQEVVYLHDPTPPIKSGRHREVDRVVTAADARLYFVPAETKTPLVGVGILWVGYSSVGVYVAYWWGSVGVYVAY
jgi:hypothetical protein